MVKPVAAHRTEIVISTLLRVGVITSVSVMTLGMMLSFVHHPEYLSSHQELLRLTQPGAAFPRSLDDVLAGVLELRGRAVTMLGLLILVATPVLRVGVSTLTFAYRRDMLFVVITVIVLGLLLLSFALGTAL